MQKSFNNSYRLYAKAIDSNEIKAKWGNFFLAKESFISNPHVPDLAYTHGSMPVFPDGLILDRFDNHAVLSTPAYLPRFTRGESTSTGSRVRLIPNLYDLTGFLEEAVSDKNAQNPKWIRKVCFLRVFAPADGARTPEALKSLNALDFRSPE